MVNARCRYRPGGHHAEDPRAGTASRDRGRAATPGATASRRAGVVHAGADRTEHRRAASTHPNARTTSIESTTTTRTTTTSDRATRSHYTTWTTFRLPRRAPDCPPRLLLHPHPHHRPIPLAAAPPPALTATCLGCPAISIGRSRKGGPARSGGPPFLESPGVVRTRGRRRGGGPLMSKFNAWRSTRGRQHVEINTRQHGSRRRSCRSLERFYAAGCSSLNAL